MNNHILTHTTTRKATTRCCSLLTLASLLLGCSVPKPEYGSVDEYPVPMETINELTYEARQSTFQLWSPNADSVKVQIYAEGEGGEPLSIHAMKRQRQGLWKTVVKGDMKGRFYTFAVNEGGSWLDETPGIFAKAVGINGQRAAIIDLDETDPEGWNDDVSPELDRIADAVIYEMHWRDFTAHPSSGLQYRGKFLSMTELVGVSGVSHLKELGITHVHILPSYDYASVDEKTLEQGNYNWGYDPLNYNVPDGSYSTNPYDPQVRIREFKQMVMALHRAGIRVVMDVVYNHVMDAATSNFERTAPGYFFRKRADGTLANGSGCGNETASNRPMMQRYMVESVQYWMHEYHVDGFRFDLMGIHDIATMNAIREAATKIDPKVLLYGEGWAAEAPAYPDEQLAMKANMRQVPGVAAFSDELRDALRGPFWSDEKGAFLIGEKGHEADIKFGILGAIDGWAAEPTQMISYVSCHDDLCLVDRLRATAPKATEQEIVALDKLAQTAVFTSQGIPFIFNGEEVMRDKQGVHNSYKSPDSVNAIDWSLKQRHRDVFDYYCRLIEMRRQHPAFRQGTAERVRRNVSFIKADDLVVAYEIDGTEMGDDWGHIVVVLNANRKPVTVPVTYGNYTVVCSGGRIDLNGLDRITGSSISVAAQSAAIIYRRD